MLTREYAQNINWNDSGDLGKIELLGKANIAGRDFLAVKIHNARMGSNIAEKVKLLPWSEDKTWLANDDIQ